MTFRALSFNTIWLVSGLATLAILQMPSIVLMGFIFLVIPGLILSVMPVCFACCTAYWFARYGFVFFLVSINRECSDRLAKYAAICIVVIAAILIPSFFRLEANARLTRSTLPEILPSTPVVLSGDVRIEGSNFDEAHARARVLLQIEGVKSVTVGRSPNEDFQDFEALTQGMPSPSSSGRTYRLNELDNCRRFADGMTDADAKICLVEEAPITRYDFLLRDGGWMEAKKRMDDWTIRWPVRIDYAEVRSNKAVLARKWMAYVSTLQIPISAFPTCGGVYETKLCWQRTIIGRYADGYSLRVDEFVQGLRRSER